MSFDFALMGVFLREREMFVVMFVPLSVFLSNRVVSVCGSVFLSNRVVWYAEDLLFKFIIKIR